MEPWDRKNPEAPTGKVYAVFGSTTGRFCAADSENISDQDFRSKSTNEGFQCLFEAESRGFGSTLDINEYNNKKVLHAAASESDEIFKVEILDVYRLGGFSNWSSSLAGSSLAGDRHQVNIISKTVLRYELD